MVAAIRAGASQRAVARSFGVSRATVQLWLERAGDRRLDRVEWSDRPSVPHRLTRTSSELEDLILELRAELRDRSDLGEYGAAAIRRELERLSAGLWPVPAARTVNRILARRGALDAVRRVRRPAPSIGWYLPDVAAQRAEVDSFDVIEGLYLRGQPELGILTAISLHGGLPGAWPGFGMRVGQIVPAIVDHWRRLGQPAYAQFDNDARFIGGYGVPDSIGSVIRLCLVLGVVPVFAPPREHGFQAAVESHNRRWQEKVWGRYRGPDLAGLIARSDAYIAALRRRLAVRIDGAPLRRPLVEDRPDLTRPPAGRLVFLRRTTDAGRVSILNRWYPVDRRWPHRLVRCELDLDERRIRFFALRRREPTVQPFLAETPYEPPGRWYR